MSDSRQRPEPTAAAASGPGQAEALVREFNQTLLRMLQARLGSREDAHEVAQEAYARFLNLGDGSGISFQSAYLFRIAHNLATDRLPRDWIAACLAAAYPHPGPPPRAGEGAEAFSGTRLS